MSDKKLTPNLQQNILALLIFDKDNGKLVRNYIPTSCWPGEVFFKLFIESVYTFIDNYHEVPGEHALDIVEALPTTEDNKDLLYKLIEQAAERSETINTEFVMQDLEKFYCVMTMESRLTQGLQILKTQGFEAAHEEVYNKPKVEFHLFDKGTTLESGFIKHMLDGNEIADSDRVRLGIPIFDHYEIFPKRKQLFLFIAVVNQGKSFFLVYAGKQALLENKKVLHISLEMDEQDVWQRYVQSLFSIAKFPGQSTGRLLLENAQFKSVQDPLCPLLRDDETIEQAMDKLNGMEYLKKNLIIKQFPAASLTMGQLSAYMDQLELYENFTPDMLVIDYADLMHIKSVKDYRLELGQLYAKLRGLATERNIMLVTASQLNREAAKIIKDGGEPTTDNIGEDWSKIHTSDNCLIYAQSELEKEYGIARLFVGKARNAPWTKVCITQHYNTGQFALSSQEMTPAFNEHYKLMKEKMKEELGK